ncbi:serine hydrolase [Sphingomonas sp. 1P08PE]|uniref:serine hydrolase n=1 Tax=Sphingomonas sp. 1P08PE TaxID=554122 RepID=UPI00399F0A60
MIRKKAVVALFCVLLTAAAGPQPKPAAPPGPAALPAGTATPAPTVPGAAPALTESDLGAWLDGYMPATLKAGKIAGAEVSVVKDGAVLVKKGYGYADVAARVPMDPDRTLMRIGSTSKLLTWTAVMQQVEQGKIDLNADINRYLDFKVTPPGGRAITMTDLMNHRAGFEEGLKDLLATDPKVMKSTERYLKENGRPFLFPAGAAPAYSNYGVALAGYIVQRVSGEPFEAYVQRHILAPLQMRHTTFVQPLPAPLERLMSKGYGQSDGQPSKFELVITAPAGSVSSTAGDMANFMIAHLQEGRFGNARILRPETVRLMHSPTQAMPAGFDTMAHGFFHGMRNGTLVIGHGGDTIVFHTDLNLLPEKGVGIFVSFNSRGAQNAVYGARERLFDLFMDRYFPGPATRTPPAIASAAGDAAAIAGHYESSRRVETGFISLFYLIQQDQVVANPDGTISVSSIDDKTFREIAPGLWRETEGTRQLMVSDVGGRRTIADSANPIAVLQAVPAWRNPTMFQLVAGLSLLTLLATVIVWPIAAWVRRRHRLTPTATGRAALARRLTRIAALADLLYIGGWYTVLAPILSMHVDAYNSGLDGTIRALQIAAIVPVAAAAIGVWNAVLAFRTRHDWGIRLRAAIVAVALLGFLWIAWMGGLIGWSLNY